MQAGDALAVIYTYLIEDKRRLAEITDRSNLWFATGWTNRITREPMPWVPNDFTGGRPHIDATLGLTVAPEPDEADDGGVQIDGVPASLWEWAAMSQADVGIDPASLTGENPPGG